MLDGMTNIKASEVLKELKDYTEDLPPYSPDEVAEALEMAIQALDAQPCEDCISRKSVRQKLQENYDFFVNAYGGFGNLPQSDKPRVDEIDNCIAIVVDEPPVIPQMKKGRWIDVLDEKTEYSETHHFECSICGCGSHWTYELEKFCPNCGAEMSGGGEDV